MSFAEIFLVGAFLFFGGSLIGWCVEVLFRRIFTAKRWINPGFLTGPYLPLYGFGITALYVLTFLPVDTGMYWLDSVIMIVIMGAVMTLIEYIAGLIFIKGLKIKLWDYSDRRGNIQGIICPLFSFFWLLVCAFYYFVIDPFVIEAVTWFVNNIAFAFVVGVLCGIFIVDLGHSIDITAKIRKFAKTNRIIVSYERLKETVVRKREELGEKIKLKFAFPFKSLHSLEEDLETYREQHGEERPRRGLFGKK